jgi:aryl-alcohol dehydrogenase-like predicted oxidoreductase
MPSSSLSSRASTPRQPEESGQVKEIAADRGYSVAQLALAWVASELTVSVALVGTRRPEEMEENAAAADWELTSEERGEIRAVVTG